MPSRRMPIDHFEAAHMISLTRALPPLDARPVVTAYSVRQGLESTVLNPVVKMSSSHALDQSNVALDQSSGARRDAAFSVLRSVLLMQLPVAVRHVRAEHGIIRKTRRNVHARHSAAAQRPGARWHSHISTGSHTRRQGIHRVFSLAFALSACTI
jgi:hypothetical protein